MQRDRDPRRRRNSWGSGVRMAHLSRPHSSPNSFVPACRFVAVWESVCVGRRRRSSRRDHRAAGLPPVSAQRIEGKGDGRRTAAQRSDTCTHAARDRQRERRSGSIRRSSKQTLGSKRTHRNSARRDPKPNERRHSHSGPTAHDHQRCCILQHSCRRIHWSSPATAWIRHGHTE